MMTQPNSPSVERRAARITPKRTQGGLGLFGMVLVFAFLAGLGVLAMQTLPTFLEYQTIVKAVNKAAQSGPNPMDIRNTFEKTTSIDNITSIGGKDLVIEKGVGDKVYVSFAYDKIIPIYPPAYLLLKYKGKSN